MNVKNCFLLLLASAAWACSHIDDGEQLIYVKPEQAKRVVLLEDFTGQRCVNCPVGLATDIGNEYYDYWHLEYQPVGLVNRHGAVNYTDWAKAVKEELTKTAPLDMSLSATLSDGQVQIHLSEYGTDGQTTGKLQVWLLEDQITAMQLMPDGTADADYVHNHVLRAAVNGTWGEDFTIGEAEIKEQELTQILDATWDPQHLSVVAFVYNDNGVVQAVKAKVDNPK